MRKDAQQKATESQYDAYRSMAGDMVSAGNRSVSYASYIGSYMKQLVLKLIVKHFTAAKRR